MLQDEREKNAGSWCRVTLLALAFSILLQLPYALGYLLASRDSVYLGMLMNPEDSLTYIAKMREGYAGEWLYTIPFTSENHAPAFVGGFYLALGQAARALGMTVESMWHVSRVIADFILFAITFGFIAQFLRDQRARWVAYLLALFGSGLGWLLFVVGQPYWLGEFPVDFKMPEAHLFFTALTFPHVAFGAALIMVSLALSTSILNPKLKPMKRLGLAVAAGFVNLALGITYPFLIYLVALTVGFYFASRIIRERRLLWREGSVLSLMFIIPAPLYVYYIYTLASNPVFRAWDMQSITLSPPWPHYLVAYGVMLLLALLPLASKKNRDDPSEGFDLLWCWVVAAALLVYAPINSQRRFVEGIQVPLAILATRGLVQVGLPWMEKTRILRWTASRRGYSTRSLERLILILFVAGMSLSNVYLIASVSITAAVQQPYPFFRSRAETGAMMWLRANAKAGEVVLAAYETGNYIGAFTPQRVVVGHWAETVNFQDKLNETATFFNTTTADEIRAEILARENVTYVWFGEEERGSGNVNPGVQPFMRRVYSDLNVEVYRAQR